MRGTFNLLSIPIYIILISTYYYLLVFNSHIDVTILALIKKTHLGAVCDLALYVLAAEQIRHRRRAIVVWTLQDWATRGTATPVSRVHVDSVIDQISGGGFQPFISRHCFAFIVAPARRRLYNSLYSFVRSLYLLRNVHYSRYGMLVASQDTRRRVRARATRAASFRALYIYNMYNREKLIEKKYVHSLRACVAALLYKFVYLSIYTVYYCKVADELLLLIFFFFFFFIEVDLPIR